MRTEDIEDRMTSDYVVVAHYQYLDDTIKAIAMLKERGHKSFKYFSPFPCHELEEETYRDRPRSPVRFFTLLGATIGCLGAFLMTTWMSVDYPIRVSAKPLISIPAFVVIAFECTILIGAIVTLISMFHFSRIPNLGFWPDYRPEFSEGTFGLAVRVPESSAKEIQQALGALGARKVEGEYVR